MTELMLLLPKMKKTPKRVTVDVSLMEDNSNIYKMNEVRTVSGLSLPRQTIDVEYLSRIYPYIKEAPVLSFYDAQPTILISQDQCALSIVRKLYQSYWTAPFVSKTLLGWVVHGRYPQGKVADKSSLIFHFCCKSQEQIDEDIHDLVTDSFKIVNFVIKNPEKNGRSKEDDRALKKMENTIDRVGNHFEIGLLWKNDDNRSSRELEMKKKKEKKKRDSSEGKVAKKRHQSSDSEEEKRMKKKRRSVSSEKEEKSKKDSSDSDVPTEKKKKQDSSDETDREK
nr:uncharacterized protein LOC111517745 [Leptinotarsa decemlineata]